MRENRTYGSEGGEPVMDNSPTPINTICDLPSLTQHYLGKISFGKWPLLEGE